MTTRTTAGRPGLTLVEVLTAIFVMALGLLALLTLFPLGALNMAQAVKDDRSGTAAQNATSLMRVLWREYAAKYAAAVAAGNPNPDPDPVLTQKMLNPGGGLPDRTGLNGPSYPVFLDAYGYTTYTAGPPDFQNWLCGISPGVPRYSLAFLGNQQAVLRTFHSSLDDPSFGTDGIPDTGNPPNAPIEREGRYSWGFLVQRTQANASWMTANLTVVVYSGRSLQLSQDLAPTTETAYSAHFTQGSTLGGDNYLSYPAVGNPPPLRRGRWVMDATMFDSSLPDDPHGYFYRVVNISDPYPDPNNAANLRVDLELQRPAVRSTGNNGVAYILEDVIEVFPRDRHPLVP
jgi:hypothetical protein